MKETKFFYNSILVLTELMAESFYAQEHNYCQGHWFLIEIERITEVLGLQPAVVFEAIQKLSEIKLIEYRDTYIENTFLVLINWLQIITFSGVPLKKEVHPQWVEGLDDVQDCKLKCVFFEESTKKFLSDLEEYFPSTKYDVPFVTLAVCNMYIKEYESTGLNFYDNMPIRKMLENFQKELGYLTKEEIEELVCKMCFDGKREVF